MVKYQINVANDVYPCFPSASFHVNVYKNTSGYLLALFMVVLRTLCLWVEEFVTAVLLFRIVYAMKCNAIYAIITSSWYLFKKKKTPFCWATAKAKVECTVTLSTIQLSFSFVVLQSFPTLLPILRNTCRNKPQSRHGFLKLCYIHLVRLLTTELMRRL